MLESLYIQIAVIYQLSKLSENYEEIEEANWYYFGKICHLDSWISRHLAKDPIDRRSS